MCRPNVLAAGSLLETEMKSLFSLGSEKFRKTFLAFYSMSVLFPILILIFIVFQHVYPQLDTNQIESLSQTFVYGMAAMLAIPLLSFFLMFGWIQFIETLTKEVRTKSAEILEEKVDLDEENEMMTLQTVFNSLQRELQDKVTQLNDYSQKLLASNMKLSELAIKDELTSLHNRRHFDLRLMEEFSRARRYDRDLALIMIDIDGFKEYNDSFGHPAGDKLLRDMGSLIKNSIRNSDVPFRYGGDEFAILCPECSLECAESVAIKLTDFVAGHTFDFGAGTSSRKITISCGVAAYSQSKEDLVAEADKCLYQAKATGKDRIVTSKKNGHKGP